MLIYVALSDQSGGSHSAVIAIAHERQIESPAPLFPSVALRGRVFAVRPVCYRDTRPQLAPIKPHFQDLGRSVRSAITCSIGEAQDGALSITLQQQGTKVPAIIGLTELHPAVGKTRDLDEAVIGWSMGG